MAQKANVKKKIDNSMDDNFNPGDLAVYPAHGVGRIEAIESREIGNDTQDFYIMNIITIIF